MEVHKVRGILGAVVLGTSVVVIGACGAGDEGAGQETGVVREEAVFVPAAEYEAVPTDPFPDDTDNDGIVNDEDPDSDGDGAAGGDNCPDLPNPDGSDVDSDGAGDACDLDADDDGLPSGLELTTGSDPLDEASTTEFVGGGGTCADGEDNDRDGDADADDSGCSDPDGDTSPDLLDNCPEEPNRGGADQDGDGAGDACDESSVPDNRKPRVMAARLSSVPAGGSSDLVAWAEDPEQDPLAFEWDLDGDGTFETPGRTVSFDAGELQAPEVRDVAVRTLDPADNYSANAYSMVSVHEPPE